MHHHALLRTAVRAAARRRPLVRAYTRGPWSSLDDEIDEQLAGLSTSTLWAALGGSGRSPPRDEVLARMGIRMPSRAPLPTEQPLEGLEAFAERMEGRGEEAPAPPPTPTTASPSPGASAYVYVPLDGVDTAALVHTARAAGLLAAKSADRFAPTHVSRALTGIDVDVEVCRAGDGRECVRVCARAAPPPAHVEAMAACMGACLAVASMVGRGAGAMHMELV